MKLKLYFGHPINTYNTKLETRLLKIIIEQFPSGLWIIENPNQKHHQEGYQRWAKETGKGMDYYYVEVLPECDGGVFLPFRDGQMGAGVFGEAETLWKRGYPIFEITTEGIIKQINPNEIRVLSVEETRLRIRTADGKIIPY